jgi:hypothetical protein
MTNGDSPPRPTPALPARTGAAPARDLDADDTTCPRCGESQDLAKVKGCIKCL